MLRDREKEYSKLLALKSIQHYLESGKKLPYSSEKSEVDNFGEKSGLSKNLGAFVTLKIDEELRGCIGSIISEIPLYENIIDNAFNAAFKDPRFPPLTKAEFDHLEIEISVMGEITPLPSIDDIEIGRDGLIVKRGLQQGLLLPQVALEWNFDRTQFLEHTCLKAGLAKDAYMDEDVEIYYFQAYVF